MNRDLPMTGFANLRNARNLRSTSRRALSANGSAGSKRVDRSFRGKVWKWANLQLGGMYHVRFCDTTVLWAYRGDVVLAKAANERRIPMIMSGSSLTRLEEVAATARAPGSMHISRENQIGLTRWSTGYYAPVFRRWYSRSTRLLWQTARTIFAPAS